MLFVVPSVEAGADGLAVANASLVPEMTPLNVWMYPVVPSLVTFAIGGKVTRLANPFRKNDETNACCMLGVGAPRPTSTAVFRVTVADADFDPSATEVAVTVTFEPAVIIAGAV
jgi:hypothetical protein